MCYTCCMMLLDCLHAVHLGVVVLVFTFKQRRDCPMLMDLLSDFIMEVLLCHQKCRDENLKVCLVTLCCSYTVSTRTFLQLYKQGQTYMLDCSTDFQLQWFRGQLAVISPKHRWLEKLHRQV